MEGKIIYVIGAGASKEVNLPIGNELKKRISELLDIRFDFHQNTLISGDSVIADAIDQSIHFAFKYQYNDYLTKAWHIRDAIVQAISIDNFIDNHRDDKILELLGKLGIVKSILQSERESKLMYSDNNKSGFIDFSLIENTWYTPFFKILSENCTITELENRLKSLVLIIFNYDRCIEHFLFNAFKNYYRISDKDIINLISLINIYHPYGKVGYLPWENIDNNLDYGKIPSPDNLLNLSKEIKTFTESTDPKSSQMIKLKSDMANANKLIFVGFAYHKNNMEIIKPSKVGAMMNKNVKCYGTAYHISRSDLEVVHGAINDLYNKDINKSLSDSTCHDFFNEYWRSLAY